MGTAVKYIGGTALGVAGCYGGYAFFKYSEVATSVRKELSRQRSCDSQKLKYEADIASTEEKVTKVTADAQGDEKRVVELRAELAKKQSEVKAATEQLTEASKSLAQRVEAISSLRKASNDLREKLTANDAKRKETAELVAQATARQESVLRDLNPLNLPQVQSLLGKKS